MKVTQDFGIRGHLFLAFGSIATATVAAAVVAWLSYESLSGSLEGIVADNLPAVTLAARLAGKGGAITATAPALAAAVNDEDRERAWSTLERNLQDMNVLLSQVDPSIIGQEIQGSLRDILNSLAANLRALDTNVRRRLWFRIRNEELIERLRWAHADFLDEVEPMIEDARFNIDLELERNAESATSPAIKGGAQVLREETLKQEALLRVGAGGNLAVGLIARAANLPDQDAIADTLLYLSEVTADLEDHLEVVRSLPESLSLRQSLEDVRGFAQGENSLFALRREELASLAQGHQLVDLNRDLVRRLQTLITERVETGNATALMAARSSRESIRRGKILLITAAVFSLCVAVLVAWLYVGRNLVRRIRTLDESMRAIAAGELNTEIPTGGRDEISDMALALSTFRDTLSETQAELVQAGKLAALGQLSAGIAHELNQPLAAIRSYAHNARRLIDQARVPDATDNLERIEESTTRMSGLIHHLRTLARRSSPNLEPVDAQVVTDNALALLDGRIRAEEVEVRTSFNGDNWLVNAEAIRFEQVMINLIGNALDAMKQDTMENGADSDTRRELTISAEAANNLVTLTVGDTGPGIPEDDLTHVFDPFFTTKEVGEGLGLGLSISYNIIKDFGGSLQVRSEIGTGTNFSLVLEKA